MNSCLPSVLQPVPRKMFPLPTFLSLNPSLRPLPPRLPHVHNVGQGTPVAKPYDVFINHRGVDTKEKEAGLIYDYLLLRGFRPFLDVESVKPGERFPDAVDRAICGCKVGILIFSPRYGESMWCLKELVLLMETGKALLPIFCDIEPSELMVAESLLQRCLPEQARKFADALQEARVKARGSNHQAVSNGAFILEPTKLAKRNFSLQKKKKICRRWLQPPQWPITLHCNNLLY